MNFFKRLHYNYVEKRKRKRIAEIALILFSMNNSTYSADMAFKIAEMLYTLEDNYIKTGKI